MCPNVNQAYDHLLAKPSPPVSLEVFEGMDNDACNRLASGHTKHTAHQQILHQHKYEAQTRSRNTNTKTVPTNLLNQHGTNGPSRTEDGVSLCIEKHLQKT